MRRRLRSLRRLPWPQPSRTPVPGLLLFALALAVAAGPLVAGEVFVPYASNRTIGGSTYRTKIWVTNVGAAPRRFTTLFIEGGTDGNQLADPDPSTGVTVSGGTTAVLVNAAPAGKLGMLEIQGAPQLITMARVEALDSNGVLQSSTNVPAVSLANAAPAKSVLDFQGLERTGRGAISDFLILNLSRQPTQCTVSAFRSDATPINQAAVVTLPALSQRAFNDVLASLGEGLITDTHVQVSCDQQFYAFGLSYRVGGPETDYISPSSALVGDLVPGSGKGSGGGTGGGGGGGGGNPPGAVVFDVPGTFLYATLAKSFTSYDLPAQDGVPYQRAVIEFDLHIGQFDPVLLFTGVTSFRRPSTNRNLRVVYYAIQIVNRNAKTTLDLGVENILVKTQGPWKANGSYHVRLTYDVPTQTAKLEALQGGSVLYTIAGPAQHLDLSAQGPGHALTVDFGQTGIADGAYVPPYGWSFSNLHVVLTPQ
jgi:hypothetical protein